MNFGDAVSSGFGNYVNFSGRAARWELWYWYLFSIICLIVAAIIDRAVFGSGTLVLTWIVDLALLLPTIAVAVRRLHDLDRSGWWVLINLIPLVGPILLIVWYCTKGTDGSNRFGPDPLAKHA